jgi:hypothetical protein
MKQAELQRAGLLGQQILAQQSELEARVRELSEVEARSSRAINGADSDGEELGEETRSKLMALGEAVGGWEKENEVLWERGPGQVSLLPLLGSRFAFLSGQTEACFSHSLILGRVYDSGGFSPAELRQRDVAQFRPSAPLESPGSRRP